MATIAMRVGEARKIVSLNVIMGISHTILGFQDFQIQVNNFLSL